MTGYPKIKSCRHYSSSGHSKPVQHKRRYFVFCKKCIHVCNDVSMGKSYKNGHFWVNYPLKRDAENSPNQEQIQINSLYFFLRQLSFLCFPLWVGWSWVWLLCFAYFRDGILLSRHALSLKHVLSSESQIFRCQILERSCILITQLCGWHRTAFFPHLVYLPTVRPAHTALRSPPCTPRLWH